MPGFKVSVDDLFLRVRNLPVGSIPAIRPIRRDLSRQVSPASSDSVLALVLAIVERSLQDGEPDCGGWATKSLITTADPGVA